MTLGPTYRSTDPISSAVAGIYVTQTGTRKNQIRQVLKALLQYPHSTSREMAERTKIDRHIVARRLPDLERMGLAQRGPIKLDSTGSHGITWHCPRRHV